ncbi:MAG TPA: alpha-amylase family glycosyl hydrolase [Oculatellaceae cyanobacterium]|jgi:glycosidase
MTVNIEKSAPETLKEVDLNPRGRVYPSPATWRDQVLYFFLPDRFSDGKETERQLFDYTKPEQYKTQDKRKWMEGGVKFQGGTIKGIQSKLDYLKELGVTTLWIGPIWRQRSDLETYHGYGIQNFLEIDPRFGTRQDLRDLVDAAHDRNMYVLLDIIYNHTGNNWFYQDNGTVKSMLPYRYEPPYPFGGWRSGKDGSPTNNIVTTDDGVFPKEFQNIEWYTRAGKIIKWDGESWENPLHRDNEFRRGDFFDLKDLDYAKDEVLSAVIQVYSYWIALSDCDGFRIDTVKHVPRETSRNFCNAIHEYAESIGKENFLLLGEVTGGAEMSRNYLDIFGRNLDAALDIGEPTIKLSGMVKGTTEPSKFFVQFGGYDALGSHRETGRYHVSILDDHDMVSRDGKHRFAANSDLPNRYQQVAHAVGVQLTCLGIPCIYYGTEQAFDGTQNRHDSSIQNPIADEDRYIRESMFGGTFGAFETEGCHFFNPEHPSYLRIAAIARIRNQKNHIGQALRRGRQYLRETSVLDRPFSIPGNGELVGWSRVMFNQEALVVLNTNSTESRGADVTVDSSLPRSSSSLAFLYKSDWSDSELRNPPQNQTVPINKHSDGRYTVRIELPPAGMAILA